MIRKVCTAVVLALLITWIVRMPRVATAAEADPAVSAEIVVKVDLAAGYRIDDLQSQFPIAVDNALLASRGIYRVHATDPRYDGKAKDLADKVSHSDAVVYAEPDLPTSLLDTRFHAWPEGSAVDAGTDPAVWRDQQTASRLMLDDAHRQSMGDGVLIAVLDTGADLTHPALQGRVVPGWDYVDDDPDPSEEAPGIPDESGHVDTAFGHGTFVSGVTAMVAPDARIMPERVLDSNGRGNIFTVAQAVLDATAAGADVINLSFGMPKQQMSKLLDEAIKSARKQGVVVVAAAGNTSSDKQQYPAAQPEVLSVAALDSDGNDLAPFSGWGDWIDVAAPGDNVAGPIPGGHYAWWRGTSVAAPIVAGQVALLQAIAMKAGPAKATSATKMFDAVTRTSDKIEEKRRVHSGAIDVLGSLTFAETHH